MFKNALQPSEKEKEKEGFGRVTAQLRKSWGHKDRGQRYGLHFISTASRAHPTMVLLIVPQKGPHSHLSTPLCSSFIVLGTFSIQSSAQLSQSLYFRVLLTYYPIRIILYASNYTPSISHSIPLLTCPLSHTTSITTSKKWIISREKSIVGTEWMNDGRNEGRKHLNPKACLMKNLFFEVQRVTAGSSMTHLPEYWKQKQK